MNDSFSARLKQYARSIGVDLIGFAPAVFDEEGEKRLEAFIKEGRHGSMGYLEDYSKRVHPEQLLPGAKSVVVIAVNYYREVPETPPDQGRIARYAYGRDYHKVLKKLLKQLALFMTENFPEAQCHICVDSSPLLEKGYAVAAGLGFIGKNTTLITPEFGSFVLLGEIITSLELDYDKPKTGTCGNCTRCIDACPTEAIIAPSTLDAKRCISYLTIEHKGPIPEEFHKPMVNLIFGCDICQEVCPYNKAFARPLTLEAFREVKIAGSSISLEEILAIKTDEEFLKRFAGSPLMRAKRTGLHRNVEIALKNAR
jgi:epoxyqueuosine reductase